MALPARICRVHPVRLAREIPPSTVRQHQPCLQPSLQLHFSFPSLRESTGHQPERHLRINRQVSEQDMPLHRLLSGKGKVTGACGVQVGLYLALACHGKCPEHCHSHPAADGPAQSNTCSVYTDGLVCQHEPTFSLRPGQAVHNLVI